jgi:hypothetical protein
MSYGRAVARAKQPWLLVTSIEQLPAILWQRYAELEDAQAALQDQTPDSAAALKKSILAAGTDD